MKPTREQFELAAKFMGYKPCNGVMTDADDFLIGLKVQTAPNVKASYWYPLQPGEDAYRLLVNVIAAPTSNPSLIGVRGSDDLTIRFFDAIKSKDVARVAEAAFLLAVELGRGME